MTGTLYLYERGTPGTRASGNLSDGHGWAADDPPTDDVWRCTVCDWEGRGDDYAAGDGCPRCNGEDME